MIKSLGCHYSYISDEFLASWKANQKQGGSEPTQPNKLLSDEMIENLMATRCTGEALSVLKQCHLAMFDMAIHAPPTRFDAVQAAENVSKIWNKLMVDIAMLHGLEDSEKDWAWGHGCARFGLLMRGYDASYYSYPLSVLFPSHNYYSDVLSL